MRSPIASLLCLIAFLFGGQSTTLFGQAATAWEKTRSSNPNDEVVVTKLDPAGNVIILGLEYRENRFHVHVARHASTDGAVVWEVRSETLASSFAMPSAMVVTPDGHAIVASVSGTGSSDQELQVTKFDGGTGSVIWTGTYGQPISPVGARVALAAAEDGSIAVGSNARDNAGDALFFAKLDPSTGTALWQRNISIYSSKTKSLLDVAFDHAGDLIAGGLRDWQTAAGGFSALKLSGSTGATLWDTNLASNPGQRDHSAAMRVDGNGDLVITGHTSLSYGPSEICTAKISGLDGSLVWRSVNAAAEVGTGSAAHLDVDSSGNAYFTGQVTDASTGRQRQITERLSTGSGTLEWRRFDGDDPASFHATGQAVYLDPSGNLVVAGRSSSFFRPHIVRKLTPADGSLIWEKVLPDDLVSTNGIGSAPFRRVAVNARGISMVMETFGSGLQFRVIKAIENLVPVTLAPSALGQRSATLRATVATTEPGIPQVEWTLGRSWFDLAPVGVSSSPDSPGQTGTPLDYSFPIAALEPNTTYYVRPKATVNGVIAHGSILWFRTLPDAQPIITLLGDSPVLLDRGQPYVEPGATAVDPEDGPLPVTITGSVDTTKFGTYTITYKATDSANKTTTETRSVIVGDRTPPVLSVGGPRSVDAGRELLFYREFATANETIISYSQNPPAGSIAPMGPFEVTLSGRDFAGNVGTISFVVTGMTPIASTTLHRRGDAVVASGAPAGATWKAFGYPCAGSDNRLAFQGTYLANRKTLKGIFADDGSGLKLLVQLGDPAADGAGSNLGDARFVSFRDPFMDASGKLVGFAARIAGTGILPANDEGLWRFDAGTGLRLVAREGDVAPGHDAAPLPTGAKIQRIVSAFIPTSESGSSSIFLTARLTGGEPAVVGANNVGIWVSTGAEAPRLALREGDTLDTPTGPKTVLTFPAFTGSAGSFGTIRAYSADGSEAGTRIVLSDGTQQLASIDAAGAVSFRLGTGSPVPNATAFKLATFGIPASWDSSFTSMGSLQRFLGGSVTSSNDSCVFNAAGIVAREGSAAAGIEGTTFKSFRDPVMLSADRSAFRGRVVPALATADDGIWAQDASGDLHLIAREGARVPGLKVAPLRMFTNLAGASDETGLGIAFTARITTGTFPGWFYENGNTYQSEVVTTQNDSGLWATNSAGTLRLVARTGKPLSDPATFGIGTGPQVRAIAFLGAVNGSAGHARGYLSPRSILYRVTFIDGAQAIVRSAIP